MIKNLVIIISLLTHISQAQPEWQTLSGKRPVVIARGGLSGVLPDSCGPAYEAAANVSLKGTLMFCDLQMTKDGAPFCQTDLRLDLTTNVDELFPKGQKTYNVHGKDVSGWFALDYTSDELFPNTTLVQNTLSRTNMFDNMFSLEILDELLQQHPEFLIWLNVQYDTLYNEHHIEIPKFIETYPNLARLQYISSPEIGFLKSIHPSIEKTQTKLIFRCLQPNETEPTSRKSYSEVLKDLSSVKEFASGILVPKEYIIPISKEMYLEAPTSLVSDAHKLGIEVYASGFANDMPASYNYSYDPSLEYLQFIDNPHFAVDGVLTDFAGTASEAIACIAHNKNASKPEKGKALVISSNGASGDYAPCTDLAYEKAVSDGADIIDCSVQMSKDGTVFCSPSPDLTTATTAVTTFISQAAKVPEIQDKPGVFSFNLPWSDIQTLKPQLTSPIQNSNLSRNPLAKNLGKIVTLAEFLDLAKKKAAPGILINIENAAYLASKKSLDVTNAVASALKNATFDKIFIRSDEIAVLAKFQQSKSYKKVYTVKAQGITTIDDETVKEIKKVADTVNLPKGALITDIEFFTLSDTQLVKKMHDANLSVHTYSMYNEFTTVLFDMDSDPLVSLATFIKGLGVDGVVTDYPATARNYLKSPCVDDNPDYWIKPVPIGDMLANAAPAAEPLPAPTALTLDQVAEPPLPTVHGTSAASPEKKESASSKIGGSKIVVCIVSILVCIIGNH